MIVIGGNFISETYKISSYWKGNYPEVKDENNTK